MLFLLRAELLKISKSPFPRGVVLFCFTLCVVLFLVVANVKPFAIGGHSEYLRLPASIELVRMIIAIFGYGVAAVLGTYIVSSEVTGDTWKAILPRHGSRSAFLVAKAMTLVLALGAFYVVTGGAMVLLGEIVGRAIDAPSKDADASAFLQCIGVLAVGALNAGALAMMTATFARSSGAVFGVLMGTLGPLALNAFGGYLPDLVNRALFTTQVQILLLKIEPDPKITLPDATVAESVLVLVLWLIVPVALACFVFTRRDVVSSSE